MDTNKPTTDSPATEAEAIVTIKNRYTGDVMHTGKPGQALRELVIEKKAYLRGADLQGAALQGAALWNADLQGAYLWNADLRGADLRGADLRGAAFGGSKPGEGLTPEMLGSRPDDSAFAVQVARAALASPESLEMSWWHTCDTAHCVAGWAVHLAGPAGYALEAVTSTSVAGCLLVPSLQHLFYLTDKAGVEQVRAELQALIDADDARIAAQGAK